MCPLSMEDRDRLSGMVGPDLFVSGDIATKMPVPLHTVTECAT